MKTTYTKLTESQYIEMITKGGFFLNGRYFQEYKYRGSIMQCKQFHKDNEYLEDKYHRYLIWKHGRSFYVTYGNN